MIGFAIVLVLQVVTSRGLEAPRMVYPRLLQERAADGRVVLQIHDALVLNLEKASIAAPTLYVHNQEFGQPAVETVNGEAFNNILYQDEENLATVTLRQTEEGVQVEGVVGPEHRIKPLFNKERSDSGTTAHMIYEIRQQPGVDKALTIPGGGINWLLEPRNAGKAQKMPPRVTVEIFIITDSHHHSHFNSTTDLISYFCVVLNSVNLRYQAMKQPKVRIVLVGVEKTSDGSFVQGSDGYVQDRQTATELKSYAGKNKDKYGDPDIVFFISGADIVSDDGRGTINKDTRGIAYVAGVCSDFFVGLGEDKAGYYTGVHTVTHEIAHLLGAGHDGDTPEASLTGHPGAVKCPFSDGYLMSYVKKGPQQHHFSKCSIQQMQFVIQLRGKACWTVNSQTQHSVKGKWAGSLVTVAKTCQMIYAGKPHLSWELVLGAGNECTVRCKYSVVSEVVKNGLKYIQTSTTSQDNQALDYTSCGKGKVCIQGVCQQTPTLPKKAPKKAPKNKQKAGKSSP